MASAFIGAIITLTSVSDIRYVGRLHSIDHQESTISLENVSSRGTETRKPQDQFVPPSDRVYDFVVFRAKDVKDLAIEQSPAPAAAPAVPDDPAIMGAQSRPPPTQQSPQVPAGYPQPPPGAYPPFSVPPGAPGGPYGTYGMPPPPPPGQGPWPGQYPSQPGFGGAYPPPPPPPPGFPQQQQQQNGSPMVQRQAPNGGAPLPPPVSQVAQPGSAAQPPKVGPTSSEKVDVPLQAPTGPRAQGALATAAGAAAAPVSKPASSPSTASAAPPQITLKPLPNAPSSSNANAGVQQQPAPTPTLANNTAQSNLDKIERALGEMSVSRGGRGPAALGAGSRQNSFGQQQHQQQGQRGQRPPRQQRESQQHSYHSQQQQASTPVTVPETEFDFEAGNKKFDKAQLAKEAGSVLVEADSDADSSDDDEDVPAASGGDRRTSSASAGEANKQQFYNKSTSFFDSISSDLRPDFAGTARGGRAPRGSGVVRGRMWRDEERVKNLDTFGEVGDGLNGQGGGFGGRHGGQGRRGPRRGPRNGGGRDGQQQQQQQQQQQHQGYSQQQYSQPQQQ